MKAKTTLQLGAAGLLSVVLAACSPTNESSSKADPASVPEVAGQPIQKIAKAREPIAQGQPIQPLAPAPETAKDASPDTGATVTAAATTTAPVQGPAMIRSGDQEYLNVGFDQLASFNFEVSDDLLEAKGDPVEISEKTNAQIPTRIRDFDQKDVAVKGYMLPLKVEKGAVTEFLIMRDQSMCCFGTVPKINEWVSVKTVGKGVKPVMDEPVTIFGKLHVGEMRENGYLVGIYRMDGEKLADPLEL